MSSSFRSVLLACVGLTMVTACQDSRQTLYREKLLKAVERFDAQPTSTVDDLRAFAGDPDLVIRVSDYTEFYEERTGVALPEEVLPNLHRAFWRKVQPEALDEPLWENDPRFLSCFLWIYDERRHFARPQTVPVGIFRTMTYFVNHVWVVEDNRAIACEVHISMGPGLSAGRAESRKEIPDDASQRAPGGRSGTSEQGT